MQTIPDSIDFSAYMRQTDPTVKVRKASVGRTLTVPVGLPEYHFVGDSPVDT